MKQRLYARAVELRSLSGGALRPRGVTTRIFPNRGVTEHTLSYSQKELNFMFNKLHGFIRHPKFKT